MLREIAADPKHLGARIGFLAVLHTWGQNLMGHPHVHCVVPGGGLSGDGARWIACRSRFFLDVRVLSERYRDKFIGPLREAYRCNKLRFGGELAGLSQSSRFERYLKDAVSNEWVVFAKPPVPGGPDQVLKYLARYTHRVAISNRRLISMDNGTVTFEWKDYANGCKRKTMTLDACEFIRRFLLHVLPTGFMRIRYYGLLANRYRQKTLERCRQLLAVETPVEEQTSTNSQQAEQETDRADREDDHDGQICPVCKKGKLMIIERLVPDRANAITFGCRPASTSGSIVPWDTS